MQFGEKIKKARLELGMSQAALAKEIGVSSRTIINYENNGCVPRKREMYIKLSQMLKLDLDYLLTDSEEFVVSAGEEYGPSASLQAKRIINQAYALFAGGELGEEDRDAFLREIQNIYFESKKISKKYSAEKNE